MKKFGCRLVQSYQGTEDDVIHCTKSGTVIPLLEQNGILVLSTMRNDRVISRTMLQKIMSGALSALVPYKLTLKRNKTSTTLLMNEARLSPEAFARLWHWRLGHPGPDVLLKMNEGVTHKLNEDCYCCDQSKFKIGSFPKNDPLLTQSLPPWWRSYCDAYGSGKKGTIVGSSLGGESYEGAVGGFVFICPSTGTLRRKLYATMEQFPAILYQFLQDVERQHFVCRELYVDTPSINLSGKAEEVVSLFSCRICPISAGTPQELAYAESGVRTLAKISRAMILGAPHLPSWAWGLSDGYATYVHDVLPQRAHGNKSPFEMRTGRKPNLKLLFIKTFGAP